MDVQRWTNEFLIALEDKNSERITSLLFSEKIHQGHTSTHHVSEYVNKILKKGAQNDNNAHEL